MGRQAVHVVCAEGEEMLAEQLAQPLREAGYEVTHDGTVAVGESLVGTAAKALTSGSPIVLCATTRSVGSAWSHQIVNAGHSSGATRVFVVQMEKQAYVDQLAIKAKVARFCDDPTVGVRDLLDALAKHFPPVRACTTPVPRAQVDLGVQYLDQHTESAIFDVDALQRFRGELREEVAARYPATLSSWEFLERAGLWVEGRLTRTGALLFGKSPTSACSAAMVKCVRYYGLDRAERRDIETFDGTVPDQIVAAREFVARHVRRGERPSGEQAQSAAVYAYPMIAIREIIANALVHRDYSTSDSCVHVRIFQDRLEISSPGSWLGHDVPTGVDRDLTELDGQSIKRNFRLAHILSWVSLVEGEGSGIPSALRDCRSAQTATPTVLQEQGFITVTLRPRPPDEKLNDPSTGAVHRVVVPANLPPDTANFVGRDRELDQLEHALDTGQADDIMALSTITGMAGVGKTALAVHFAHRVADRFPDGQLYANLQGFDPAGAPMQTAEALALFLNVLGVPPQAVPAEPEARAALYRSLLSTRRMLVVLDNVKSDGHVLPLLPGTPGCLVVVTSRSRLTGLVARTGARTLSLDVLTETEAATLLARRMGSDRVAAEPQATSALIHFCARLPLALAIVAARAAVHPEFPLSALADELRDEHRRLDAFDVGDEMSVRAVFSWTYRSLSSEAALLFRLLSLHPGPDIGLPAAAALADLPVRRVRTIVTELCTAHLLEEHLPSRYRFHDLLRAYANERSSGDDSHEQRQAAVRRMVVHYLNRSLAADRRISPGRHTGGTGSLEVGADFGAYAEAVDWFSIEHPVLLAAIDQAARTGFDSNAWQLARAITPFLNLRGQWHDLAAIQEIALAAADRLGDGAAQAYSHRNLGAVYGQFGRFADAITHYQRSLEFCRELGDRAGEACTLLALSEVHERRNQPDEAIDRARLALELFRAIADRRGEARALAMLASCEAQFGRYRQALTDFTNARALFREVDDSTGESVTLEGLGYVHHRLKQYHDALEHYREALHVSRNLGNRYGEAVTLNRLGDTYQAVGDPHQARDAWQIALTLLTEFEDPDADTLRAKLAALGTLESGTTQRNESPVPTIIVVDIARYADPARFDSDRLVLQRGLHQILGTAFRRTSIEWESCLIEYRGDGMFILAPSDIPKALFIDPLPHELVKTLREHNDRHPASQQVRLRVALHAGEVFPDEHGVVGASANFAFRLVDAVPLRRALDDSDGVLALIVSDWFYNNVVRPRAGADLTSYSETQVTIKETNASAWVRVPFRRAEAISDDDATAPNKVTEATDAQAGLSRPSDC